ncbi:hypothetical protein Lfu02_30780 [Longispora fulva]|nr:hypothetical protein Lfu02_30780 [Longispora fulva]
MVPGAFQRCPEDGADPAGPDYADPEAARAFYVHLAIQSWLGYRSTQV